MPLFIFRRSNRDIADRAGIAGDGFDALLVIADHDIGLDIAVFQRKMMQEQLQCRTAFRFIHHRYWRIRSPDLFPVFHCSGIDAYDLLIAQFLDRIALVDNYADTIHCNCIRCKVAFFRL